MMNQNNSFVLWKTDEIIEPCTVYNAKLILRNIQV